MRQSYTAVIDRPIGYQDRYGNNYPINYGYIPNLSGKMSILFQRMSQLL